MVSFVIFHDLLSFDAALGSHGGKSGQLGACWEDRERVEELGSPAMLGPWPRPAVCWADFKR